MNLGGPRSLAEVEPYLYELFSDPLVVTAPFGPLRPLFAKIVSKTRAPSSAEKYALIGGKSPIVEGTEAQARALAAGPRGRAGPATSRCAAATRTPRRASARRSPRARTARSRFPLYPQYANATTRSSLLELRRVWPKDRPLAEICTWHDHEGYLDASAAALRETLARVPAADRDRVLVVFSAHGLPMSQVRKGDPYPGYIEHSARETARRAGVTAFQVTYQSRVGPTKWLGPDTIEFLEANARDRVIVAVPIAFVSEHLETLYDLDILAKAAAEKGGARGFLRVPALGTRPDFVAAMADVVRKGAAAQPAAA